MITVLHFLTCRQAIAQFEVDANTERDALPWAEEIHGLHLDSSAPDRFRYKRHSLQRLNRAQRRSAFLVCVRRAGGTLIYDPAPTSQAPSFSAMCCCIKQYSHLK